MDGWRYAADMLTVTAERLYGTLHQVSTATGNLEPLTFAASFTDVWSVLFGIDRCKGGWVVAEAGRS